MESSPCRYSWALEVSERRSGSTTSVEKEAKVSGLAKTGKHTTSSYMSCTQLMPCILSNS